MAGMARENEGFAWSPEAFDSLGATGSAAPQEANQRMCWMRSVFTFHQSAYRFIALGLYDLWLLPIDRRPLSPSCMNRLAGSPPRPFRISRCELAALEWRAWNR
jgi:hypothetical protein